MQKLGADTQEKYFFSAFKYLDFCFRPDVLKFKLQTNTYLCHPKSFLKTGVCIGVSKGRKSMLIFDI